MIVSFPVPGTVKFLGTLLLLLLLLLLSRSFLRRQLRICELWVSKVLANVPITKLDKRWFGKMASFL
jgi:hypothetical protein